MGKEIFGLLLALTSPGFLYYVHVNSEYFLHTGLFFLNACLFAEIPFVTLTFFFSLLYLYVFVNSRYEDARPLSAGA
jgi:hypothetical protein